MPNYWRTYSSYLPQISDKQKYKLDIFFKKICEEAVPRGFVGKADQETLWLRHILDSLLVLHEPIDWGDSIIDLGSGAGLPGAVLGIIMPDKRITLLDSSRKKVNFLLNIKRMLRLDNVTALAANADKNFKEKKDTIVFRAFQKPIVSLELSLNHLKLGGQIVYWRNKSFMYEQDNAINQKILDRLKCLGINIKQHIQFKTPATMNERGVYVLSKDHPSSDNFPRPFNDILADPLNRMLKNI